MRISFDATGGAELTIGEPSDEPVEPLDDYRQKVLRASSRNTVYPYELTGLLGDFVEHDLDADHALVPVDRPKGRNTRGDRRRRGHHADRAAPARASPGWCCSATRPSRWARCPSRSAAG